jgi:hypothetical protein
LSDDAVETAFFEAEVDIVQDVRLDACAIDFIDVLEF